MIYTNIEFKNTINSIPVYTVYYIAINYGKNEIILSESQIAVISWFIIILSIDSRIVCLKDVDVMRKTNEVWTVKHRRYYQSLKEYAEKNKNSIYKSKNHLIYMFHFHQGGY